MEVDVVPALDVDADAAELPPQPAEAIDDSWLLGAGRDDEEVSKKFALVAPCDRSATISLSWKNTTRSNQS